MPRGLDADQRPCFVGGGGVPVDRCGELCLRVADLGSGPRGHPGYLLRPRCGPHTLHVGVRREHPQRCRGHCVNHVSSSVRVCFSTNYSYQQVIRTHFCAGQSCFLMALAIFSPTIDVFGVQTCVQVAGGTFIKMWLIQAASTQCMVIFAVDSTELTDHALIQFNFRVGSTSRAA